MPDNTEFFAVLHHIQSTANEITEKIDNVTAGKTVDDMIKVPVAALLSFRTIIELQSHLVVKLVEENEQIVERLEKLANEI